ncbi:MULTISPECIES: MarR family transcriptional regulator [unclassified Streptomyces]|uniref:MarR family winged helix-turn-helix transcriptional regulator n=1 Tax=unclassified Streptomyces TaxID=2593676 RepID=UPI002E173785|nr:MULTISPECIES: MarR family transcriptional regulator [unclassified Streptomyces]
MAPLPNPENLDTAVTHGDMAGQLGLLLRRYQQRMEHAVEGLPGGLRGYQILAVVAHRDPPNQQAIGIQLAIDRTVLTYQIDALTEAGLVERIPDPADRRARKVVVTSKGVGTLPRFARRVAEAEAELLSGLTVHEADAFRGFVCRLAAFRGLSSD